MNKYDERFDKFISIPFSKGQLTFAIVLTLNNIISYVICIKYQLGDFESNITYIQKIFLVCEKNRKNICNPIIQHLLLLLLDIGYLN